MANVFKVLNDRFIDHIEVMFIEIKEIGYLNLVNVIQHYGTKVEVKEVIERFKKVEVI